MVKMSLVNPEVRTHAGRCALVATPAIRAVNYFYVIPYIPEIYVGAQIITIPLIFVFTISFH